MQHRVSVTPVAPQSRNLLLPMCFALLLATLAVSASAETCVTQSGMPDADRMMMSSAAVMLAQAIQANDTTALRATAITEIQKDFASFQYLVGTTSPKLTGGKLTVDQVYLLDATTLKPNADNSPAEAQFFCSLNQSTMEADFLIPALPAGKYGFAIVTVSSPSPWRMSFLLRQEQGKWLLAGFYPKPLTASGHDGLWYWTQARQLAKDKQPWDAWLYYQAATMLLRPADFIISTHLDKLRTEAAGAAPPTLSDGISVDAPLVVKGIGQTEYHFTSLGVDDTLAQPTLDIAAHLSVEPLPDAAAARQRNIDAMAALLKTYPEMRQRFHGVWIYADSPGQRPFATEQSMAEIK